MPEWYYVTMPDGSRWKVPVELIAVDRAKYYAELDEKTVEDSLKSTRVLFELVPDEITDWAQNNMDWEDVRSHALCCQPAPLPDYQKGWTDGDVEIK